MCTHRPYRPSKGMADPDSLPTSGPQSVLPLQRDSTHLIPMFRPSHRPIHKVGPGSASTAAPPNAHAWQRLCRFLGPTQQADPGCEATASLQGSRSQRLLGWKNNQMGNHDSLDIQGSPGVPHELRERKAVSRDNQDSTQPHTKRVSE